MNELMEWSKNIVCFSIFAALIKNLLPGEKYTPYVRLYIGFMMLLVFLTPILKVLNADVTLDYLTELLGETLEIQQDSFLASINENSNYENQKKEYTEKLQNSVREYLSDQEALQGYFVERTEVSWEEEEENPDFGKVTSAVVYLKKADEQETQEVKKKTDEIEIDSIHVAVFSDLEGKGQEMEGEESGIVKRLLSDFYQLKEETIQVKVVK